MGAFRPPGSMFSRTLTLPLPCLKEPNPAIGAKRFLELREPFVCGKKFPFLKAKKLFSEEPPLHCGRMWPLAYAADPQIFISVTRALSPAVGLQHLFLARTTNFFLRPFKRYSRSG